MRTHASEPFASRNTIGRFLEYGSERLADRTEGEPVLSILKGNYEIHSDSLRHRITIEPMTPGQPKELFHRDGERGLVLLKDVTSLLNSQTKWSAVV